MTDLAALGLTVRSDGLVVATDKLEDFERASGDAAKGGEKFEKSSDKLQKGLRRLAGVVAPLVATFASGALFTSAVAEAQKFETSMFRVEAIIRATNGVAQRSADDLREQARQIAFSTLESTEGILRAQQTLLTFRNVQGDVFDRTIRAATDMTAALGGDLNSATLQLAKALEDPVTGMTALTRSGTVFTTEQKEMVKAMVEVGDLAKAQAFILSELEAQYGGTAEAAAGGLAGAQDTLGQALQEAKLALAEQLGLLEAATAINNTLADAVIFVTENIDSFTGVAIAAAGALTTSIIPSLAAVAAATYGWVTSLVVLRGALIATGIGAIVVAAGLLIGEFLKLVRATGSWGSALEALGDLATGVWDSIKTSASAIVPALNAVWQDVRAGFFRLMEALGQNWADFLRVVAGGLRGVPGAEDAFATVSDAAIRAQSGVYGFGLAIDDAESAAERFRAEAAGKVVEGGEKIADAMRRLRRIMTQGDGTSSGPDDGTRGGVVVPDMPPELADNIEAVTGPATSAARAIKDVADAVRETDASTFNLGSSLAGVFTDAVMDAKKLQDGLRGLLQQMSQMFLNQAFTQFLGNVGGDGILGSIFGGFRADGGPVSSGRAYVVGERGPELFMPGRSGTIIPNVPAQSGGGGTVVQVVNNSGQPARQERSRGPDGREIVRVIVGEEIGGGGFDKQLGGRYGNRPVPVRR